MRLRALALLCCMASLGSALVHASAPAGFSVDIAASNAELLNNGARISLAIRARGDSNAPARLHVELITPTNSVLASGDTVSLASPDLRRVDIDVTGDGITSGWTPAALQKTRLRYVVRPAGSAGPHTTGIIALSRLTSDAIALTLLTDRLVRTGTTHSVHVIARSLSTSEPVRGATCRVELTLDGNNRTVIERTCRTDSRGVGLVRFPIPVSSDSDEATIEATLTKGAFTDSAEIDVTVTAGAYSMLLSTDKSMYQPGQTIHARVLVVDDDDRAASGRQVRLEVEDDSGETVLRREITTSRFGVASIDVPLRDDAPLGPYEVTAEIESDSGDSFDTMARVIVSRYDLPNFTVRVASDKPFYLPGDTAKVTVSTEYLFGQPVPAGRVRIEPYDEDSWLDSDDSDEPEAQLASGTCGPDGSFDATIDLASAWSELGKRSWMKYYDGSFVATVTDPSTNRTERRRFDLRITYQPIHIHVFGRRELAAGESTSFYVTTTLADGTAVPCDVTVLEPAAPVALPGRRDEPVWRTVAFVRTNRYGVARVRTSRVRADGADRWSDLDLRFDATGVNGGVGSSTESFDLTDDAIVTVEPGRSILPVGAPVEATATTTSSSQALVVHLVQNRKILETKSVALRSGEARILFPYRPTLSGRLSIVVVDPTRRSTRWYGDYQYAVADVLYPSPDGLEVTVAPKQPSYAPGESLSLSIDVKDGTGLGQTSALAIAAVDAAVRERQTSSSDEYLSGGISAYAPWQQDSYARIGSVSMTTLRRLDPTREAPPDLDLVAAVLMSDSETGNSMFEVSSLDAVDQRAEFKATFDRLQATVDRALYLESGASGTCASDTMSLVEMLRKSGANHAELVDPWGNTLAATSIVNDSHRILRVQSAGPDAVHGTSDDVTVTQYRCDYFSLTGQRVESAVRAWMADTGRFVRDEASFAEAMRDRHIETSGLLDAWGRPYAARFSASGSYVLLRLESAGVDGRFDASEGSDDFTVWRTYLDFFGPRAATIEHALADVSHLGAFPTDTSSWQAALVAAGIDPRGIVDQYDSEAVPAFRSGSRFAHRAAFEERIVFGSTAKVVAATMIPVTEAYDEIVLTGPGEDRRIGTADDLRLATFTRVRSAATADGKELSTEKVKGEVFAGDRGAIAGVVTDPQGAVIAGATVRLLSSSGVELQTVLTIGDGTYAIRNLSPGRYTVKVEGSGFGARIVESVPVYPNVTVQLDFELSVAGGGESVDVVASSGGLIVNTENQSLATTVTVRNIESLPSPPPRPRGDLAPNGGAGPPRTTPRLRQYFPETVYWNPELVTDSRGRARIKVPLADSITTWQFSVLASTEDGRVAFGSAEVLAYQPFFVEHDPPRVLTEGDRIGLPVIVRNYLDSAQSVDLSISPAPWFTIEGAANRKVRVDAGASSRQLFDVRTVASVDDGAQRVTGLGDRASDAVEKPVDVHPHGEERIATASALFAGTGTLEVRLPDDVLGAPRTTLKVYPDLFAHVVESVEGIMQRPHGCGEQTISSTYPSLLLLRHSKDDLRPALETRATKFLAEGYERLKSYRAADGGIGYWIGSQSHTALTAYALRFLLDADGVIDVDGAFVNGLRDNLLAAQRADGGWEAPHWYSSGDRLRDAMETAYVAGVLARLQGIPSHASSKVADAVQRGLAFAAPVATGIDEPYLTASIALAAMDSGNQAMADGAIARLVATARTEGATAYWTLETNTPFCGWGLAGRVETTARVVRALARYAARNPTGAASPDARSLADRGTHFLLKQKDRYGVWYSSQATISVLDALLEQVADVDDSATGARSATVLVDGREVGKMALPETKVVSEPLAVDLSAAIGAGRHTIEVAASDGSKIFAQVVARHYVPWVDAGRDAAKPNRAEKREDALRLAVEYDRLDAAVGQPVTCTVTAERIGHRGYGMLVAEIGLPPGNDVDRSSLDRAASNSGWTVCKYDVLPDRVVVYLWPRAGGVTFSFRFTTRYGIEAMAAPSWVYDYYNPESNVVLEPPRFVSVE